MAFSRAVQRYGRSPEPDTPYQRAGQLWDERIGSARVQARNWRMMAFGGLALSIGLSVGLVWQSMQSRVTPYVVEVDRLGEPMAVSPAQQGYQPTDPQIAWHLAHFVHAVRTISIDPVLMRDAWLDAYDFTTRRGAQALSDYARVAKPFAEIGEHSVSVEVTSVVRASDRSFQVKWIETAYDHGAQAGTSHWTAILTIVTDPPTTADALRKNPLGIYVDAIDWSRELEPASPTPPPAPAPVLPPPAVASQPDAPSLPPSIAPDAPAPLAPSHQENQP